MDRVSALPIEAIELSPEEELLALLEAARRANWDALHGPVYLRSGRYRPVRDASPSIAGAEATESTAEEATPDDVAARRR